MFSSKKQLIKRTGKSGVGRYSFLQQLINEYNTTKSRGKLKPVKLVKYNHMNFSVNTYFLTKNILCKVCLINHVFIFRW